jgi:hypothetical protein
VDPGVRRDDNCWTRAASCFSANARCRLGPGRLSGKGHQASMIHCVFKPYRVIYRIVEKRVLVYVIADGRRNMQTLLARRLLE